MDQDNHEKLQSEVSDGRMASVCLQFMQPILSDLEQELTTSMKTCFRTGKYSELILASHVAQLCAVEDLRNKLRGISNKGESAHQRLNPDEHIEDNDPYGERE